MQQIIIKKEYTIHQPNIIIKRKWVDTNLLLNSEKKQSKRKITSLTTIRLTCFWDWRCFAVEIVPKFLKPDAPYRSILLWSSPKTSQGGPGCYEITAHSPTSGREIPGAKYIGMSTRPVSERNQEEFKAAARGYGTQQFFSHALRELAKAGAVFRAHQTVDMTGASRRDISDVEASLINWEIIYEEGALLNTLLPRESERFLRGELTPPKRVSFPRLFPEAPDNGLKMRESRISRLQPSKVQKKLDFSSCGAPREAQTEELFSSPILDWPYSI